MSLINISLERYIRTEQCSSSDLEFLTEEIRTVERVREKWLRGEPILEILKYTCRSLATDTTRVFLCDLVTSLPEEDRTVWNRTIDGSLGPLIDSMKKAAERFSIPFSSGIDHSEEEENLPGAFQQEILDFFQRLLEKIIQHRISPLIGKINNKYSLADPEKPIHFYRGFPEASSLEHLYENVIERIDIDFTVYRFPFGAEVLDPRLVVIKPGKFNEKHKHAHETLFVILKGHGTVLIDDQKVEVHTGDIVFVPRWCIHQSQNLSEGEMTILAITDFGLTGKAFIGNYHKTARLKQSNTPYHERSFDNSENLQRGGKGLDEA